MTRTALCAVLVGPLLACGTEPAADPLIHAGGAGDAAQPFTRNVRAEREPVVWSADEVQRTLVRVAEWALANPAPFDVRDWPMAPLYDGLIDASLVTGDPKYLAAVIRAGRRSQFTPRSRLHRADAHAAGHAWLRIYLMMEPKDSTLLAPFQQIFDELITDPPRDRRPTDRWTWADALYMAPPTIAALAQATGDDRYLEFMNREFRFAYGALFDRDANLFYRDATYVDARTPNGEKVFWSRGNSWVYAGLALTIEALPVDHDTRPLLAVLYRRMSKALHAAQQADGFWYPSLLDPEHVYIPETSGSALFVLGTAWGVRRGMLVPDKYWPVVKRGWKAIASNIDSDGAVEFVQPPGACPEAFDPDSRAPYGTGAVLMAAAEILRATADVAQVDPIELVRRAQQLAPSAPDLSTECDDPCGSVSGATEPAR